MIDIKAIKAIKAMVVFATARLDEDEAAARNPVEFSYAYAGRVLRGVAAKRLILAEDTWGGPDHADMWEAVIRDLITEWDDHPDYKEGWKP